MDPHQLNNIQALEKVTSLKLSNGYNEQLYMNMQI